LGHPSVADKARVFDGLLHADVAHGVMLVGLRGAVVSLLLLSMRVNVLCLGAAKCRKNLKSRTKHGAAAARGAQHLASSTTIISTAGQVCARADATAA